MSYPLDIRFLAIFCSPISFEVIQINFLSLSKFIDKNIGYFTNKKPLF
jgi:hypothetical protein